jgi:predicted phosphodiesterase
VTKAKAAAGERDCDQCGETFNARHGQRYCKTACRIKAGNDQRQRRADLARNSGVDSVSRLEKLTRIEQLLEDNGVPVDEIGSVKNIRVKKWQAVAKGAATRHPETGRITSQEPSKVVDLESASILISPTWAEGPKWELPHPPAPITVRVPKAAPKKVDGWKKAMLLPDPQIGYRRDLYTAELDPFHDERALDIALQVAEIERPDLIIVLGDWLDFASFGKYRQEAAFALTVQPTLDTAYSYLARFRALTDEMRFIEGNHDIRLQNMIIDNAKAAFGIKRAGVPPGEWPVLSVQNLLRMDELGIEYVGGYPAGATYINDNIAAIHGRRVGNDRKSAASMVVEDERVSVVFGHVHRIETTYRTRNTRGAPKISVAHTPGCLCRIDGAVPGVKGGIDAFGRAITSFENWQQSVSLIRYQDGDGKFAVESTPIIEGWALHQGRELTTRVTPAWAA